MMLLDPMVNMWERVTVDVSRSWRSSLTRTAILELHPELVVNADLRPLNSTPATGI